MHIISVSDAEGFLGELFGLASKLSAEAKKGIFRNTFKNKTLAMIFEKASTRTRVSFEVAMAQLGGYAIHLDETQIQMHRGESLKDTALTLSRYVDAILMRVRSHGDVVELARYATVPVINGLSDLEHPCQVLSDLYTIREKRGFDSKLAYVGDGNNVCNSLLLGSAMVGMDISAGCPRGYEPDGDILKRAKKKAREKNSTITITNDPKKAVKDSDVVYTDVWVSMGHEAEENERMKAFKGFQVNSKLLKLANDPLVMHCLPAKRGVEITDDVIDGRRSIVFEQAENRLHIQKALLCILLGGKKQ